MIFGQGAGGGDRVNVDQNDARAAGGHLRSAPRGKTGSFISKVSEWKVYIVVVQFLVGTLRYSQG